MEPTDPYAVVFSGEIRLILPTLPVEARVALAEILEILAFRPWQSIQYHPRLAYEWRSAPFGDGLGLVGFVVSEKQHRVIVVHVTWLG